MRVDKDCRMKKSIISAVAFALIAVVAQAETKPATTAKPTTPQGMGKACNPACGTGTYCVDGQCVDNGVKAEKPAAKSATTK